MDIDEENEVLPNGTDNLIGELLVRRHNAGVAALTTESRGPQREVDNCPDLGLITAPLDGMKRLQQSRDQEISPRSIVSALLWELCQLTETSIASVINTDGWPCFQMTPATLHSDLDSMQPEARAADAARRFRYSYPFNKGMRQAEYVFWPYQYRYPPSNEPDFEPEPNSEGRWVLIIIRLENNPLPAHQWDRLATQVTIVDPVAHQRAQRRRAVEVRLEQILEAGHIRLVPGALEAHPTIAVPDLPDDELWATGHVCYAVAREMFRRLRVILGTGARGALAPCFYAGFDEPANHDHARKCMLSACALRAVEKSRYFGQLAVEVPAAQTVNGFDPVRLRGPHEQAYPEDVRYRSLWHDQPDPKHAGDFDDDERYARLWLRPPQEVFAKSLRTYHPDPYAAREIHPNAVD
ncbi:uncharacterized protein JN550_002214 [Neoarthrinium moseri]|uniref:uncharacterized protein n=1 Tax=Neoarthrinium moseri TaxID=1658444 RepID=UPI001FDCDC38|nr:uncharacterized protein JN550_002214 [Neoarthrinium moseri]KAI1874785.1 hypothetical protein JN550_002214 [Neoarthrinium moseri]